MWSKSKQQTKLCFQEKYTQGVLRLLPSPLREKRQEKEEKAKKKKKRKAEERDDFHHGLKIKATR